MTRAFFLSIALPLSCAAAAMTSTLWGVAPDYAGRPLQLTTRYDGLSGERETLATVTPDSAGRFRMEFDLDQTRMLEIGLGYYSGRVYMEPGKTLQVEFPPKRELTEAQRFNPYFTPKALLLSVVRPEADDMNVRVEAFDDLCDSIWSDLLFRPVISPELIENGIGLLESRFPREEEDFFYRYKRYNYAMLVNLYQKTAPYLAIETYFAHDSVDYANPAYWEAFDLVFEQFDQAEAMQGNPALYELIQINRVLRRKLPVEWLDNVTVPGITPIARSVGRQLTAGAEGSYAGPGWINLQGDSVPAADPYGRPTYLVFANRRVIECASDLACVARVARERERDCRFVVVFANEDGIPETPGTDNVEYLDSRQNPSILTDFGIRNIPAYFLLDSDGRIKRSPAPDPEHYLSE